MELPLAQQFPPDPRVAAGSKSPIMLIIQVCGVTEALQQHTSADPSWDLTEFADFIISQFKN